MDHVPGGIGNVHGGPYLRRIIGDQIPLGIGELIQKAQLKYRSPVGNGRDVTGQLHIGVGMVGLADGGGLRLFCGHLGTLF